LPRAIAWREQDVGGDTLMMEVAVRIMRAGPEARAIAVEFTRAVTYTIEVEAST